MPTRSRSAVRLVVQLARLKGGARKLLRVSEIVGLRKRRYLLVRDVFGFRQTGVAGGQAVGEFYATGYVPRCLERIHAAGIDLAPEVFRERRLRTLNEGTSHDVDEQDLLGEDS